MMILDKVREHPWLAGAAVIVIGYIVLRSVGGGSGSSTYSVGGDPNSVAAATALQSAQLQAQSQGQQIAAELQGRAQSDQAALALAKIQSDTSINNNTIAANVSSQQISAAQQVQSLLGTLSSQVATNEQNQQTARISISTQGQVEQQKTLANALIAQSTNQTNAAIAQANAQASVYSQAISCTGLKALFGGC